MSARVLACAAVTFVGLCMGMAGAAAHSPALLLASLAVDMADGALARRLNATSLFGAALDLTTDIAVAVAVAGELGALWAAVVVVIAATIERVPGALSGSQRVTGRAALTCWACFTWWPA